MEHEKFKFTYSAPTKSERNEIEDIRKNYLPKSQGNKKLQRLKTLDSKVKNTPTILALVVGILGTLIFGLGLTMILEWNISVWGVIVSAVGLVPTILANFVYKSMKDRLTEKYREEILALSEELLNENKNEIM